MRFGNIAKTLSVTLEVSLSVYLFHRSMRAFERDNEREVVIKDHPYKRIIVSIVMLFSIKI